MYHSLIIGTLALAMICLCLMAFNITLMLLDDHKDRQMKNRLRAAAIRKEILKLEGRDAEL
jgi:hypothetical protein